MHGRIATQLRKVLGGLNSSGTFAAHAGGVVKHRQIVCWINSKAEAEGCFLVRMSCLSVGADGIVP